MSGPQKVYRVGIAPLRSPKDFLEHKIVLAVSLQEALDKITRSGLNLASTYEIRQIVLVDVVDIT